VSKNALLRSLNVIHAVAPIINVGARPAFHQFMQYVGMVCDMACLHFEGELEGNPPSKRTDI
jgi:hypothetical protein